MIIFIFLFFLSFIHKFSISLSLSPPLCVCVCVCVRERERERENYIGPRSNALANVLNPLLHCPRPSATVFALPPLLLSSLKPHMGGST